MWEKIKESSNVKKVKSYVMLVMHNVKMEMSNVRKKKKPLNVTKILPNLMLVLLNVTIKPSNVKKKKKKKKN